MTSLVAAPIVVSGDIWGAVVVSLTGERRFPANAEERLGQFAGLVAVALANAQAREELATLADEQAALSRVAVAVATEEDPERLFNAVSEEIGRLFGARAAATVRYVDDADEARDRGRSGCGTDGSTPRSAYACRFRAVRSRASRIPVEPRGSTWRTSRPTSRSTWSRRA